MPFILNAIDDTAAYEQFESVLIVPCRFCPAASAAVKSNEPYFEIFRRFLKTDSYERFIKSLKSKLEKKGIKTGVFKSRWLHQFVRRGWRTNRSSLETSGSVEETCEGLRCVGCVGMRSGGADSPGCGRTKSLQSNSGRRD